MTTDSILNISMYNYYLGAAWLQKHLEKAGVEVKEVSFNLNHWVKRSMDLDNLEDQDPTYGFMFHVAVMTLDGDSWYAGTTEIAEQREELTARALAQVPGAHLARRDGRMYLYGALPGVLGMRWHLSLGMGVCQKVKVGTRKVMKPDPRAKLVEVEEDVYEVRCVDPIAEGQLV